MRKNVGGKDGPISLSPVEVVSKAFTQELGSLVHVVILALGDVLGYFSHITFVVFGRWQRRNILKLPPRSS